MGISTYSRGKFVFTLAGWVSILDPLLFQIVSDLGIWSHTALSPELYPSVMSFGVITKLSSLFSSDICLGVGAVLDVFTIHSFLACFRADVTVLGVVILSLGLVAFWLIPNCLPERASNFFFCWSRCVWNVTLYCYLEIRRAFQECLDRPVVIPRIFPFGFRVLPIA